MAIDKLQVWFIGQPVQSSKYHSITIAGFFAKFEFRLSLFVWFFFLLATAKGKRSTLLEVHFTAMIIQGSNLGLQGSGPKKSGAPGLHSSYFQGSGLHS